MSFVLQKGKSCKTPGSNVTAPANCQLLETSRVKCRNETRVWRPMIARHLIEPTSRSKAAGNNQMELKVKVMIFLNVLCTAPGDSSVFGVVRKEWDTDLVPMPGIEIEDSAWKNPRRIERVTMNPQDGYYDIWAGDDEADTRERAHQKVQMYQAHDWQVLSCGDI